MDKIRARLSNKKFLILRHGKTEWNLQGKMQGRLDSNLLKSSHECLRRFGNLLEHENVSVLYHSPLGRVIRSIEIMGLSKDIHKISSNQIVEINHGIYEGQYERELPEEFINARNENIWHEPWPHGESYHDVEKRVILFFRQVAESDDKSIAIMAHESVNKVIIKSLLNLSTEEIIGMKQDNSTVYKVCDEKISWLSLSNKFSHGTIIRKM